MDERGLLLAGHAKNANGFGLQLSVGEARRCLPFAKATTMQVVAGAMSPPFGGSTSACLAQRARSMETQSVSPQWCRISTH
jgi:hypothetical protein